MNSGDKAYVGIGKVPFWRVGNRERGKIQGRESGKKSFWDWENGIFEGRESEIFFSQREKNASEIGN